MSEICVLYQSEDEHVVERLVELLRVQWKTWWAKEIAHGDWEEAARTAIGKADLVLPVLSKHTKGSRASILKDEMKFAGEAGKPLLPFIIGPAEIPFGFGNLNFTKADGWVGDETAGGFNELRAKIASTIGTGNSGPEGLSRPMQLKLGKKTLRLPTFVFSLSSYETQVWPDEGAKLLHWLKPEAILLSAYDKWNYLKTDKDFKQTVEQIRKSNSVLFLDSGNYESGRKGDRFAPKKNPKGWRKELFWESASAMRPDLAFTFDRVKPKGEVLQIAERIVKDVIADRRGIPDTSIQLVPIVHLPELPEEKTAEFAASLLRAVAAKLEPVMIAIPERELGDGLIARVRTVKAIRAALNSLGKYVPLHLLGTGNPLSMVALAAAGADSFDGLEWCRTIADYDTGFLFHFQHFECFSQSKINRVQDLEVRLMVENGDVPYTVRALAYNIDFFKDHVTTMQNLIHSGQTKSLLNMIPNIGPDIFRESSK